jgi:hypothetical protein
MRPQPSPTQIECLACGAVRVVHGLRKEDTGECPRCHYVGWAYSDELDGTTRRQIMNGSLAVPQTERTRPGSPGKRGRSRFT